MRTSSPPNPDGVTDPASGGALSPLLVFDRLEVGPCALEKNRITTPYRLYIKERKQQIDLVYRYEEAVFDPGEAESINLASMISAQVAVNYGLFCRVIALEGLYDDPDRRFIRQMAENTAREIYVKRFLQKNPYLKGPAARTPAAKFARYCSASIEFPSSDNVVSDPGWKLWPTRKDRCCILSSGGKDSLLSYGLMSEVTGGQGTESRVHPIFVNESGRHWLTALNAYRYFREQIPNTARVWINSDRVFAFMLRHMPFIRKDFADVRSDDYPIRLWTVPVFLFGVLPLLRKREIGRLVIGNEYDTSRRKSYNGITHYDGLYDQSIYFDNALSRYFLQKGWSISQFSVLRPLSELLILKMLSRRYPNLQQNQVSCHAAHKEQDRVAPCGRCEKCRRIVGMLLAIGADPGRCDYSPKQVAECLRQLSAKGVRQDVAETEQLLAMLEEMGEIPPSLSPARRRRQRTEVLKIRIDPERSPLIGIPRDLRRPLFRIYREYAEGCVRRRGRRWEEFDLPADPELNSPYPFELDRPIKHPGDVTSREKQTGGIVWGELRWPEAERRFQEVDIALLPVGAIEQHGPHLPLDTDAFDAEYLSKRVAGACSDPKPLVLPLVPYGVSYHHVDFKGTVSISNETLSRLVYDLGMSVAANGIKKLVIINGHGGNSPALNYAAQMINRDSRIFVCVDTGETSDVDIEAIVDTPNDVHAGEVETSTSLAVRPHLVRLDLASRSVPEFSSRYLDFTSKRGVSWYAYTRKISTSGVMGDPTKASAKKGEQIWEMMIAHMVGLVEDLKRMTLEEIHHRRL